MVVPRRGKNFISTAQHVLPHYLRRYVRITRLGQITISGFANEAAFALWIEPTDCLAIRNDRSEWCALCLFCARTALLLLPATAATAPPAATLSAAPALIASATAVVTVIAIAVLTLVALLLSLATATAAALSTAKCLRIVLRLLL